MSSSSYSPPRYPLPPPASQEEREWRAAGRRLATLARVADNFPLSERASIEGKGFSPEYQRALLDRDRAALDLTKAHGAMVKAGLRRMGTV